MTTALVLAAGEGTRLRPYTVDRPKCLVELGDRPLLGWQREAIQSAGIERIVVATGHHGELIDALGYETRHNPAYMATNMVASMMCAGDLFDGSDDVIVCYGDIVYERRVIEAVLATEAPLCTTVDKQWRRLWELRMADPLSDAESLRIDQRGNLVELGRRPSSLAEIDAQYMGIIAVRRHAAPGLVQAWATLDPDARYDGRDRANMFMTSFLQHLIDHGQPVRAVVVEGGWLEVDTCADLELYEAMQHRGTLAQFCRLGA